MTPVFQPEVFFRNSGRGLCRAFALLLAAVFLLAAVTPAKAWERGTATATLLKNCEYGDTLLRGVREARSSILVSCYLFKITDFPGNIPRRIAGELVEARRRGVAVTVILEQSPEADDPLNRANRTTATLLSRNGVNVRFDSLHKTTHVKAVVIDGRYVYLGSHNLTHSALTRNNELSVLLDSPETAREVMSYLGEI
jgi:phosphatidylserine/phosphatidylglycerophosphate/cardiolipin synthase-like enzyme